VPVDGKKVAGRFIHNNGYPAVANSSEGLAYNPLLCSIDRRVGRGSGSIAYIRSMMPGGVFALVWCHLAVTTLVGKFDISENPIYENNVPADKRACEHPGLRVQKIQ
jgi:hypothetical protein